MRRVIRMDIHRTFAEVVFWEDGWLRWHGRVDMTWSGLEGFGRSLTKDDEVVLEASARAEDAWVAAQAPGPLHAFFMRIRGRRGHQTAAVATARKMAVLVWHLLSKETDYLWARPALVAHKLRALELQAG